jgi:hypothetical protein
MFGRWRAYDYERLGEKISNKSGQVAGTHFEYRPPLPLDHTFIFGDSINLFPWPRRMGCLCLSHCRGDALNIVAECQETN